MKIDLEGLVRPDIAAMAPYQPILPFHVLSQQLGIPPEKLVKLDANENPYGTLPEVLAALAELEFAYIYPDPESRRIRALLSDYLGLDVNSIVMGSGADELIDLIMRLTLSPGDVVLNCPPTFGMYDFDAMLNQAQVANVPRNPDFTLDLPAIDAAVKQHAPKLLFLANPNNPDGQLLPAEYIEQLLSLPLLLVLDEAYIHFSQPESSWIQHVNEHDNLIVLRTFSKWGGLAGLRAGYGIFPMQLVPYLMKIKQPYNLNVAAEAAACAAIENHVALDSRVKKIINERKRLYKLLQDIHWLNALPGSQSNFILCRVAGKPARQVKQTLMEKGILLRYFDKPGLKDCLRITVGTPQQNDILIDALKEME